jgi:hypothetical protein
METLQRTKPKRALWEFSLLAFHKSKKTNTETLYPAQSHCKSLENVTGFFLVAAKTNAFHSWKS